MSFNRYGKGQMTVTVLVGWRVHIDFVNSGGEPHSFEVIREVQPLPLKGGAPAILDAVSRKPYTGIPPQAKDSFDFTAAPAGQYLWFCGVQLHGQLGMWDRFFVSATASAPSVTVK